MTRKFSRAAILIVAVLALSGCEQLDTIQTLTSGWFSSKKKSDLKGERIDVMATDESMKPDPTLADTPVVLPPPYLNKNWTEPGGYAGNALYHMEAPGPLKIQWKTDTGKGSDSDSRVTAPPIVVNGRIYVLDSEAHVFAVDASSGAVVWDKELAPTGGSGPFLMMFGPDHTIDPSKGFGGGIAFDDGKIFVTTGFGQVFALNPADGAQLWKINLGVPVVNAPVANGGRVFVSSQDNHMFALAQKDGRTLWDHQGITESAGILESTSAAVAGDYLIAPYSSGELYAIRVEDGRVAWNDMLTRSGTRTALSELDDIAGRPVVDRDMVFAIAHSGVMVAINLDSGQRVWTRDIGGIQTPWVAGDFLYVLTTDQLLLCLQRKDGRVKWVHQLPRWKDLDDKDEPIVWSGPVLVSDRLVAVSSSGFAEAISPYTGKLLARMEIPDSAYIAPVVASGTLYLYTNSAQLIALR
jgi:outer membrane protein assembly factor BamB